MALWIGLYPKPFFEILQQPVNQLVMTIRPDYPGLGGAVNASAQPPAQKPVPEVVRVADIQKGSK